MPPRPVATALIAAIWIPSAAALADDQPDLKAFVGHYVVTGETEDGPCHGVAKVTLGPYPDRLVERI